MDEHDTQQGSSGDAVAVGEAQSSDSSSTWLRKVLLLVIVGILFAFAYAKFGDSLSLENLTRQEANFREFQQQHPWAVYVVAFVIYVSVTGLSLPGAAALTMSFGWFFGFVRATILVSFASTAGATIAFLLSRFLFRESIQNRFGKRLAGFNRALEREGAFYLFTLRLIPAVPFFIINVVMGLTTMRVLTYWWVSQVGMLAGTCAYVYAGSVVPSAQELADRGITGVMTPQLFIAFALLGVFPIVVKKLVNWWRPTSMEVSG